MSHPWDYLRLASLDDSLRLHGLVPERPGESDSPMKGRKMELADLVSRVRAALPGLTDMLPRSRLSYTGGVAYPWQLHHETWVTDIVAAQVLTGILCAHAAALGFAVVHHKGVYIRVDWEGKWHALSGGCSYLEALVEAVCTHNEEPPHV